MGALKQSPSPILGTAEVVRQRQLQLAFENARLAIFPLTISAFCYAALLANLVPQRRLASWLAAMLGLIAIRGVLALIYQNRLESLEQWARVQLWLVGAIGSAYGITALWVSLPEHTGQMAVMNLWLCGLAVAALLGQGIIPSLGLAFAVPSVTPLIIRMLLANEPTLTAVGIANLLFFFYVSSVVMRAQHFTLSEVRTRATFESLAERLETQRQQTDALVDKLTREVGRRKRIQAALKQARDEARRESDQDHLTGLATRRILERTLRQEWAKARGDQVPISLILCDVDRFRPYNERYGHHAGDLCLARIARALRDFAHDQGNATVARYGGEEFALLMPRTDEYAALEIAEAIRSSVYEQTILHGASDVERVVTASCGVATIVPTGTRRADELAEAAALALKRAKAAGRNCVFTVYGGAAEDEG